MKKTLLIVLGLLVLGGIGYSGYQYYKPQVVMDTEFCLPSNASFVDVIALKPLADQFTMLYDYGYDCTRDVYRSTDSSCIGNIVYLRCTDEFVR